MDISLAAYIGIALLGIYLGRIALEILSGSLLKNRQIAKKFTVLQVRVAKENETGPIVAEQIFATIHGIYQKIPFWKRIFGKTQERISFEIANIGNYIKFYIAFPKKYKNFIEGQIYAQYPDVEIEEVEDYSRPESIEIAQNSADLGFLSEAGTSIIRAKDLPSIKENRKFEQINLYKNTYGLELKLINPDLYPIKRYAQFEDKINKAIVDPLAGITATLAKLNDQDEQAWIQYIVRPLDDKWRTIFVKCLKNISKGKWANIGKFQTLYTRVYCTRSRLMRIIFFPIYFIFWLKGLGGGGSLTNLAVETHTEAAEEETTRSHEKETAVSAGMDKVLKLMFEATIRVVYMQKNKDTETAKVKLQEIAGSFKQFNIPQLNGFTPQRYFNGNEALELYRSRFLDDSFVLNIEELASIYHLPNKTVATPNIFWVQSRKLEPPTDLPNSKNSGGEELTMIGKTNFRGITKTFGIKLLDRRRHVYIIGKTGMGKTTLLENMIYSDIMAGKGVGIIDPHGDLAESVMNFIPPNRTNDVILFDPSDRDYPVAFNMLESANPALNTIIASGLLGIFKKLYSESWGPRLEHILRNTILTLLEYPNTTMLGIIRILQDRDYRRKVTSKLEDPVLISFWKNEFESMQDKFRVEAISPILNKVGQFLSSPIVRNIVGQPKSTVNLRFAMDKGKIIIVNLSKGRIGEDNSQLLGSMLITKFQIDAMSRADVPEKERRDFYLYVDEFQNFATDSFATILSEARKYRLNLTMANQYIAQMPDEVKDAVFGNVGSIVSFQVGFDDAEYISQQFGEEAMPPDLVSLSKYTAYMKLLIDGMPSKTFSLNTLPSPMVQMDDTRKDLIRKVVRERYTQKREDVEDKIKRWSAPPRRELPETEEKKNFPPRNRSK